LIAQITDFMTLEAGDVLLVGVPENMPRARAGDRMSVDIEGVGRVSNTLRAQGAAP
jgi:5-oxopent-3-ene-1,2,5-tricarboxylate decarboxylase/2-hydroxyhepta-2,4-diene-1,7-dioate isomerase